MTKPMSERLLVSVGQKDGTMRVNGKDYVIVSVADLTEAAARLKELEDAPVGWRPIETAPKDGTLILLALGKCVQLGWWRDDKYAKNLRPYWTNNSERWLGKVNTRNNQPTYWMPLPELPK